MDMKKIETMTSRERVIKTINHEPVDRMPIDLGMHYSSGISAFAYQNLRQYLNLSTDNIKMVDMIQLLANVDEDILKRFHCDCILLHPGWKNTTVWNPRDNYKFNIPSNAKPQLQPNSSYVMEYKGNKLQMPEGGYFFDGGWPNFFDGDEDEEIAATAKEAERIYKETDYFTTYIGFGAFFEGSVDWLCDMMLNPKKIYEENEKLLTKEIAKAKKIIDSMGNYVQAIALNSDLGAQNAPLCRPSVYNDLCAPFVKKFCDFVHQNSDFKIFLHSCGSIEPMIPTIIDCGIDILNPVQISASNMDPKHLKNKYGDSITFWGGGCNTQEILGFTTPEKVRENVRELTTIFKPNGGFVFNQVHNIMGNVPPENIVAMLDEAYKLSWY